MLIQCGALMRDLVVGLFGATIPSSTTWESIGRVLVERGKGASLPNIKFFNTRIKSPRPFTNTAVNCLALLYTLAMEDVLDDISYRTATVALTNLFQEKFGIDCRNMLVNVAPWEKVINRDTLLLTLQELLALAHKREVVEEVAFREIAEVLFTESEKKKREWLGVQLPNPIVRFYSNVQEVCYSEKILKCSSRLDIVYAHGLTWMKAFEESLRRALSNESLSINVVLLDPASPFFASYAEYKHTSVEWQQQKTLEVISTWNHLYKQANPARRKGATLSIKLATYLPAKSLFCFDSTIIATPLPNHITNRYYMSYECHRPQDGGGGDTAFDRHQSEIRWLIYNGKSVDIEHPEIQFSPTSASGHTGELYRKVAIQLFGSLKLNLKDFGCETLKNGEGGDFFLDNYLKDPCWDGDQDSTESLLSLVELSLKGSTKFDPIEISTKLANVLRDEASADARGTALWILSQRDSVRVSKNKTALLLYLLRSLLVDHDTGRTQIKELADKHYLQRRERYGAISKDCDAGEKRKTEDET